MSCYIKELRYKMDKDYLIKKWLKGELTEAERQAFEQLPDYEINVKIVEAAKQFKAPEFSQDAVYHNLKARLASQKTPVYQLNSYRFLYRIAAVLIIALSGYFYIQSQNIEVHTQAGQHLVVNLPDQSEVVLNAASSIRYNKFLWRLKRGLSLDGEAFFKVQKGSQFDVKTGQGVVSVVGTQFDVKSRPNVFEVKCFEGIVRVQSQGQTRLLTRGKAVKLANQALIAFNTNKSQPEWLKGQSRFNSTPLSEVLDELSRQYNIKIITQNVDTQQLYTGGFAHDNLTQALKAVTEPFGLQFRINQSQKTVNISGQ